MNDQKNTSKNEMSMGTTLDLGIQKFSQSGKAVDFWNNYHSTCGESKESKEWIIHHDSEVLMELLQSHLSLPTTSVDNEDHANSDESTDMVRNILEIGCGTSCLSRSLMEYLLHTKDIKNENNSHERIYQIVATDVSQVCVQWNKDRDESFIQKIQPHLLDYRVLDVIDNVLFGPKGDKNNTDFAGSKNDDNDDGFDMIIDKGCLDTFLFRGGSYSKEKYTYPPLLTKLLHNIHAMLNRKSKKSSKKAGKYIIITPRSKIKAVRDFQGFSNVQRIILNTTKTETNNNVKDNMTSKQLSVQSADLERGNGKKNPGATDQVYIYICTINSQYHPNGMKSDPYKSSHKNILSEPDSSTCDKCQITFEEYRSYENICHKGKNYWTRRWNSHRIHCKGKK